MQQELGNFEVLVSQCHMKSQYVNMLRNVKSFLSIHVWLLGDRYFFNASFCMLNYEILELINIKL